MARCLSKALDVVSNCMMYREDRVELVNGSEHRTTRLALFVPTCAMTSKHRLITLPG